MFAKKVYRIIYYLFIFALRFSSFFCEHVRGEFSAASNFLAITRSICACANMFPTNFFFSERTKTFVVIHSPKKSKKKIVFLLQIIFIYYFVLAKPPFFVYDPPRVFNALFYFYCPSMSHICVYVAEACGRLHSVCAREGTFFILFYQARGTLPSFCAPYTETRTDYVHLYIHLHGIENPNGWLIPLFWLRFQLLARIVSILSYSAIFFNPLLSLFWFFLYFTFFRPGVCACINSSMIPFNAVNVSIKTALFISAQFDTQYSLYMSISMQILVFNDYLL